MADRFHPSDLIGARVHWLLDLTYAGMTLRLASDELDVLTDDGDSLHYHGTIQTLDVDEGVDFLSDSSAAPTSASIDVVLPVDVPLLIARGHDLGSATGVLSRWIEGTTYEKRRKVILGGVRDPIYGAKDEPVSFSLEMTPWTDSRVVPAPSLAVVGANLEDDWATSIPTETLGAAYPLVFGRPGKVDADISSTGRVAGTQAVPIWLSPIAISTGSGTSGWRDVLWLLAGHHVATKRVWIATDEHPAGRRCKVYNGRDRAGHPIAFCPWWGLDDDDADVPVYPYSFDSGVPTYSFTTTDTDGDPTYTCGSTDATTGDMLRASEVFGVYVAWDDEIDDEGGAKSTTGATMSGAGDAIEWLLGQSSIPIDRGRFAALRPILNAYELAFTIDAAVTPWAFIAANILPILPISIVSGPNGLYPVHWRYDAGAGDAVAHLNLSTNPYIMRGSSVNYDRSNVANDLRLDYALSIRTGDYQGQLRLSAGSKSTRVVDAARAFGQIATSTVPLPGATLTIDGHVLTAVAGAAGVDEFTITVLAPVTTTLALFTAITDPANSTYGVVTAAYDGATNILLHAPVLGTAGNAITLSTTALGLDLTGPTLTGGAAAVSVTTVDGTPSYHCAMSQRRYRQPDGTPAVIERAIKSNVIYSSATAASVLSWMARAYCYARRRVEYLVPESTYGWLERGQIVTVTDADIRLAGQVCMIESIRTSTGAMLRLRLLLIEDPTRDARLV